MGMDTGARGLALGSVRISTKHEFDTLVSLNSYFSLNPNELIDSTYAIVGTQATGFKIYRYYEVDSQWYDVSEVYRGDRGSKGDKGTSIDDIVDYSGNTIRIFLDDNTYYDVTKTQADAEYISLTPTTYTNRLKHFEGNQLQELADFLDTIDEQPKGEFYFGDKTEYKTWKIVKEDTFLNFYRYDEINGQYNLITTFGASVESDKFIITDWSGSLKVVAKNGTYRTMIRPSIDGNGAVLGNSLGRVGIICDGEFIVATPNSEEHVLKLNDISETEGLANAITTKLISFNVITKNNAFYTGIDRMVLDSVPNGTTTRIWVESNGEIIAESMSAINFYDGKGDAVKNGDNAISYMQRMILLDESVTTVHIEFSNEVKILGSNIDLGNGVGVQFIPILDLGTINAKIENVATQEWIEQNLPVSDSVTLQSSKTLASSKAVATNNALISAISGGASPLVPTTCEHFSLLQKGINGQHYLFTDGGVVNGVTIRPKDHAYIIQDFDYTGTENYINIDDYVVVDSSPISSSGVYITNVTTSDINKNVSLTMNDAPNNKTVASVLTDASNLNVTVIWDRSSISWTGGVPTVNGVELDNISPIVDGCGSFTGTATIPVDDSISAVLGEVSYNIPIAIETPPIVSDVTFLSYPNGQTSIKEGDLLPITITSDKDFNKVIVYDYELSKYGIYYTTKGKSAEISIIGANRGYTTATQQHVKLYVVSESGSRSNDYISTSTALLNNIVPLMAIDSIIYPSGQLAIKNSESVTINYTCHYTDSIEVTGEYMTVSDKTLSSVVMTRANGDYKYNSDNVLFTLKYDENGATTQTYSSVNIVNVPATCTDTLPIYCSSTNVVDVTTNFSQMVKVKDVSLPLGIIDSPTTVDTYELSYPLRVSSIDSIVHSNNVVEANVTVVGLSGIETVVTRPYGIKGFNERTLSLKYPNNILSLPTNITTANNVVMNAYINSNPPYYIGVTRVNSADAIDNVGKSFYVDGSTQVQFASTEMLAGFGYSPTNNIVVMIKEDV